MLYNSGNEKMGGVSMNCMKCGREIGEDQVFCAKCLEAMDQYPVNPEIVVKLPARTDPPVKKYQPRKKPLTQGEQILRLKQRTQRLTVAVCLLLALVVFLTFLSIDFFRQLDVQRLLGQNYSTALYQ